MNRISEIMPGSDLNVTVQDLRALLKSLDLTSEFSVRNEVLIQMVIVHLNQKQYDVLAKCSRFGWKIGSVVWNTPKSKIAIGLHGNQTAAWLLPSACLLRAPIGKNSIKLPEDWAK